MVSLEQMCKYAAASLQRHCAGGGTLSVLLATTLTSQKRWASLMALADQEPVLR